MCQCRARGSLVRAGVWGSRRDAKRPASTSRPFVGLMRGRLFSSRRTHSLGHGEDSRLCPPHPHQTHPATLPPHRAHTAHTHRTTAAAAPSLSILLGSGCPGSSGSGWSGCACGPSRRGREGGVGPAEITCQPGEHLHSLTCHCFPPNKVQSSAAAFREPPRIPRIPSPRQSFWPFCQGGARQLFLSRAGVPSESASECLIGAESWRTQPICLGIWAIWAPGLSISNCSPLVSAMVRSMGARQSDGRWTVCRVPRPGQARPPAW